MAVSEVIPLPLPLVSSFLPLPPDEALQLRMVKQFLPGVVVAPQLLFIRDQVVNGRMTRLADLHKELAQAEAVPVYALFTNEQLAQMVQRRCRSKSDLAQIEGIGESKIEKNADRLLPLLLTLEAPRDASNSEPV